MTPNADTDHFSRPAKQLGKVLVFRPLSRVKVFARLRASKQAPHTRTYASARNLQLRLGPFRRGKPMGGEKSLVRVFGGILLKLLQNHPQV